METKIEIPKVFASYSWQPEANKERVKQIVDRLRNDGIDVVIDIYDLNVGHDKYSYMERMVNDPSIKKVLIFSNKEYAEKGNLRKAGVGTESIIISKEVYRNMVQEKFIPISLEKDDNGEPYFPSFIGTKIYIDLSNEETFEDEYIKLVKIVYGKPIDKKSPLGQTPSYVLTDDPVQIKINYKLERLKASALEGRRNIPVLIDDYLENFLEDLSRYRIDDHNEIDFDEDIVKLIDEMKPIRDNFLRFFEILINIESNVYLDKLHNHFETWIELVSSIEVHSDLGWDHLRFLFKEIFLYMVSISLLKGKFEIVDYFLNKLYWVAKGNNEKGYSDFTCFYFYLESLEKVRKNRISSNRLSIATDILVDRIDYKQLKLKDLQDADMLLCYVSMLGDESHGRGLWFPYLSMFHSGILDIMKKAESENYFNRVKCIFKVENIDELKDKISNIPDYKRKIYQYGYDLVNINYGLNIEALAKHK